MAEPQDLKHANQTYSSFISTLKWTVPLIAVLTLIVLILIS